MPPSDGVGQLVLGGKGVASTSLASHTPLFELLRLRQQRHKTDVVVVAVVPGRPSRLVLTCSLCHSLAPPLRCSLLSHAAAWPLLPLLESERFFRNIMELLGV
jgi:hypothetical protein